MTPTETTDLGATDLKTLPQFDGFPYLNTRLVPALYHITLLPADTPLSTLLALTGRQFAANRLDTCLVLGADRAVYHWADGLVEASKDAPRGGTLVTNELAPPVRVLDTPEMLERKRRLERRVDADRRAGAVVMGDLAKGGRSATTEEIERLQGKTTGRVPRGLERCRTCGDWRGECLDPNLETFAGMVMPVACRCANHNRCARCGQQLYERRLNANYYDARDGNVWHVPGFCGMSHKCPQ